METEDETQVQEEVTYSEIDKLQEMGINRSDIQKLKQAGIHTVAGIMMSTKAKLENIKGMSEAKITKIMEASGKVQSFGFVTGTSIYEKRKTITRITTGSSELDKLLGGGIESGSITEAFGEFRTGKTQLAHMLCVTSQMGKDQNGGNGKVIYIDTEGTFRPDRVVEIAKRFEVDAESVLDNINYARAYTTEMQQDLLIQASARMIEDRFSCIIIDSSTALFRVDFTGRGQLSDRQCKLGLFLSTLTKMAEEFQVAVYITNQVMSDPSGQTMGDNKKPIGGNIMGHACTTRIQFKKGRGEQRIAKMYDSPCLPEAECVFQLTEQGISNVKDA